MASIGRFYLRMLRERTLPTQMLTSCGPDPLG